MKQISPAESWKCLNCKHYKNTKGNAGFNLMCSKYNTKTHISFGKCYNFKK